MTIERKPDMYSFRGRVSRSERGQALVIMVVAMIAALAMVALIVDGGNAWAQQRITQNGTDAAANAGATVLARRLAGEAAVASGPAADAAAKTAVDAIVSANGIDLTGAYYTDICGVMLRPDGTRANSVGEAALVGAGDLPTDIGQTPDCPSGQTGPVAGVRALGNKPFSTFIAPLIGLTDMTAGADATAVTGYLQGLCEPENDEACVVLPVTFPTTVVTCDGSGEAESTDIPWTKFVRTVVPLCKDSPGSVGWLDWDSPDGGASELADAIVPPPYNDPIDLPSWQYVTATGDISSSQVQTAMDTWDGQIVFIPMFDLTCNPGPGGEPDHSLVDVPSDPGPPSTQYGCNVTDLGGSGLNQWYRIPQVAAFLLEHAYINGPDGKVACETATASPRSCLIGQFVDIISTGTVGAGGSGGTGETSVIGVQLIK